MTSTPDYQQPPPAWGPQQQPVYYPELPPPPDKAEPQATGNVRLVLEVSTMTFIGLGALAAAMVAGLAPFLRFWLEKYTETIPGPRNNRLTVNGFGQYTYHPVSAAAGQTHGHDSNYGVPLIAAAAVLAIAAVLLIAHKGNEVLRLLLVVIGGSMLAGIAVEGAMDRGARFSFDDKYTQWSVGYGWWLMILAGALGALMAITATASVVKSSRVLSSV